MPARISQSDTPAPKLIAPSEFVEPIAPVTTAETKNDVVTRSSVSNSSPIVMPTAKTGLNKTRPETTSKAKTQRANIETQVDASNNSKELHQNEVHPVSGPQPATNAGTNKNHDAATPVANFAPHSKSAPAKSEPEISDSAPAAQIPDADDAPVTHTSINTAKLVQGLSQSELRVGLQTRDFGNIDIRTSASRHEFSAQISVEHSDIANTLTTELPGLYARLNEQQVPVGNIHIQNQSLSTSTGLDQNSQQSSSRPQNSAAVRSQLEPTLPAIQEVLSSTDRLDIRI